MEEKKNKSRPDWLRRGLKSLDTWVGDWYIDNRGRLIDWRRYKRGVIDLDRYYEDKWDRSHPYVGAAAFSCKCSYKRARIILKTWLKEAENGNRPRRRKD